MTILNKFFLIFHLVLVTSDISSATITGNKSNKVNRLRRGQQQQGRRRLQSDTTASDDTKILESNDKNQQQQEEQDEEQKLLRGVVAVKESSSFIPPPPIHDNTAIIEEDQNTTNTIGTIGIISLENCREEIIQNIIEKTTNGEIIAQNNRAKDQVRVVSKSEISEKLDEDVIKNIKWYQEGEVPKYDQHNEFIALIRNPIDRIIAAFLYEHVKNAPYSKESMTKTLIHKEKIALYECYDTIDELALNGLSPVHSCTDRCSTLAHRLFYHTIDGRHDIGGDIPTEEHQMMSPFINDFSHYYSDILSHLQKQQGENQESYNQTTAISSSASFDQSLLPAPQDDTNNNKTIYVIRSEEMLTDLNNIHNQLGGEGSPYKGASYSSWKIKTRDLPAQQTKVSAAGMENLCRALCVEIQIYKQILTMAANLDDDAREISRKKLSKLCPKEEKMDHCEWKKNNERLEWESNEIKKSEDQSGVASCHFGVIHLGKCHGIGMKHSIEAEDDGVIEQKGAEWYHMQQPRVDLHDDFIALVRNPVDRIIATFLYEHVKNAPYLIHPMVRTLPFKEKLEVYQCFDTIDELATVGLDPSNKDRCGDRCSHLADSLFHHDLSGRHNVVGMTHFVLDFAYYYSDLLKTNKTIYVVRNENMTNDLNGIHEKLGGSGRPYIGSNFSHWKIDANKLPAKNKIVSSTGMQNLCKALCVEIQIYKELLNRAVNFNDLDRQASLSKLQTMCPQEVNQTSCEWVKDGDAIKWESNQFKEDSEKSTGLRCKMGIIHLGKCYGEGMQTTIEKATNGAILERGVSYYHMQQPKMNKHNDFISLVRNPVDRIIAAFYFDHVKNAPYHRTDMVWTLPYKEKLGLYDCFDTIDDLAVIGLDPSNRNNCAKTARELFYHDADGRHNVPGMPHFVLDYAYYYTELLQDPTKTIYIVRNEQMERDLNNIHTELGGTGRPYELEPYSHWKVPKNKLPASNSTVSSDGLLNLCRALCVEIQIYKELLKRATNLDDTDREISRSYLRHLCPREVAQDHCVWVGRNGDAFQWESNYFSSIQNS